MRDKQIYRLFRLLLGAAAPVRGLEGFRYLQRHQPTQQGVPTGPVFWMDNVSDVRRGQRQITTKPVNGVIVRTETQGMEKTIQFSVTQPPNFNDPNGLTNSDALKTLAAVIASEDFISEMVRNGVTALAITQIRNTYFKNDKDEWEENPTFDLTVKHTDVWIDGVPYITTFEFGIYRISGSELAAP